jgi:UDP-N-acetylmuramoylalanine--D-glutamate ligase
MNLQGKRVHILGAGTSGRAAAALALAHGARVEVFDARDEGVAPVDGAELHLGATPASAGVSDLLVVSPGIPTGGPLVEAFAAQATEMMGEIELASRFFSGCIIAITGTNGKTTTTELVERIMNRAGFSAVACGNYGRAVCEVVGRDPQPEVLALEASSFQLETIVDFRPDVAIWLNFSADHMDRYRTIDEYRAAKMRIFENQTAADFAVIRDGESMPELAASVVRFSTEDPEVEWFSDGRHLRHRGEPVIDLQAGSMLRGRHNAENAMAAVAACLAAGADPGGLADAFADYRPPRHRCEWVQTIDGIEWLNDSKATNLHALESALRSLDGPVVLIAGGKNKGLDYAPLRPIVSEKVRVVVTFGEIGPELAAVFAEFVRTEAVDTLPQAVQAARNVATAGDTVLFSPGTSSFDQFSGYEERGNLFCQLVTRLF